MPRVWTRAADWWLWTAPTGSGERDDSRRYLAALLGVAAMLCPVVGLTLLPWWVHPDAPTETATFRAVALLSVAILVAFFVNRRGHRGVAASIFVLAAMGSTAWSAREQPLLLVFVSIEFLLATGLFTPARAAVFGAFGLLMHPLIVVGTPATLSDVALPLALNTTLIAVAFLTQHHHLGLARARAEDAERRQRWFSTTLRSIGDAVLTVDSAERVTFMNPIAEELTGWRTDEAMGRPVDEVFRTVQEHTKEPAESPVRRALRERRPAALENHTELIARDGSRRPIADSGAPIIDASGRMHGVVLVFRDMEQTRALQAQLLHAQRLDALGQLAGGVAHDFNNLLTAIGAGIDMVRSRIPEGSEALLDLDAINGAAQRAVGVTGKLLAFSRRQVMQPKALDLNDALIRSRMLLRSLLRDDVELTITPAAVPCPIVVDPVQLDQVIINLAINAQDAMPSGGRLDLSCGFTDVDDEHPRVGLAPGSYGWLRVADTGQGIDDETLAHIFEPFFTTKSDGRGTGLGLATVYGVVQQSGGAIDVETAPNVGTTFVVSFPSADGIAEPAEEPAEPPPRAEGEARIVYFVEDDPMVRSVGVRALVRAGYRVVEASGGPEALSCLGDNAAPDVLVTDLVMPHMSGPEVAREFRERFPSLPILFTSGYADEDIARDGFSDTNSAFLAKPYRIPALCGAVASMLRASAKPPSSA